VHADCSPAPTGWFAPVHQLRKWLGPVELTLFGVGMIIGTGIFVLTGKACGAASVRVSG
jgi:amino acid permease